MLVIRTVQTFGLYTVFVFACSSIYHWTHWPLFLQNITIWWVVQDFRTMVSHSFTDICCYFKEKIMEYKYFRTSFSFFYSLFFLIVRWYSFDFYSVKYCEVFFWCLDPESLKNPLRVFILPSLLCFMCPFALDCWAIHHLLADTAHGQRALALM